MTIQPRSNASRNTRTEELSRDIVDLATAIDQLPAQHRDHIRPIMDKAIEGISRRRRILKLVQDALSQLRMDMKYLVFDLEATRRERDAYREQLDNE